MNRIPSMIARQAAMNKNIKNAALVPYVFIFFSKNALTCLETLSSLSVSYICYISQINNMNCEANHSPNRIPKSSLAIDSWLLLLDYLMILLKNLSLYSCSSGSNTSDIWRKESNLEVRRDAVRGPTFGRHLIIWPKRLPTVMWLFEHFSLNYSSVPLH